MADLYFRDLNQESQRDFLNYFRVGQRRDLLEAIEDGKDVKIGETFETGDVRIV